MMNEEIKIQDYKHVDSDLELEQLVALHREIFIGSPLYGKLIYFDSNFPNYLKNIVNSSQRDFFFVARNENLIKGFAHFKIFDNSIFLNNICVSNDLRGKGIGGRLFKYGLDYYKQANIASFSLDVFSTNTSAIKWYEKMGLKIAETKDWKQIIPSFLEKELVRQKLKRDKDSNGFDSIFIYNEKVATVVNDTLIVSDANLIQYLTSLSFRSVITTQDVPKAIQYSRIARSFRMTADLNDLLKKI